MHALRERGENRLRVQMVRRGHRQDIEIGKIAQDVVPRRLAEISARLVAGPFLEMLLAEPSRADVSRARGDGDQFEFHRREFARPFVEADARELAGDAEALQIGVSAQVNIAAEHAGAGESDFDGAIHNSSGASLPAGECVVKLQLGAALIRTPPRIALSRP